jgi:CDP-6-deoxy-D-xylo-4-hexulose-3-dehydrase
VKKRITSLRVPYALSVYDDKEIQAVVRVLKEHRSNIGQETKQFEESVSQLFAKKYGVMVNSGSSANLLAFELLNLPEGSEVITPLLTFSTTIAPLLKKKLIPVFADIEEGTYQINVDQVEPLITKKTKAILVPLLLGNVPDMKKLQALAKKHKLFLIEDSCDTLAATYKGKPTGAYTDITTTSFFGSHIITAGGNGGMICVNNLAWREKLKLLRGWGRLSSILSETEDITTRYKARIGKLPYDAKYIFDEIGYNFLPNEMCAAFGNEQLRKLSQFKRSREKNFSRLHAFFATYEKYFILPKQDAGVVTQWLAFPLTLRESTPFSRVDIVTFLEKENIQTRTIFTGNILRQPGFKKIPHRVIKRNTYVADAVMERGFLIGCHHGLTEDQLKKIENTFIRFLKPFMKKKILS